MAGLLPQRCYFLRRSIVISRCICYYLVVGNFDKWYLNSLDEDVFHLISVRQVSGFWYHVISVYYLCYDIVLGCLACEIMNAA